MFDPVDGESVVESVGLHDNQPPTNPAIPAYPNNPYGLPFTLEHIDPNTESNAISHWLELLDFSSNVG